MRDFEFSDDDREHMRAAYALHCAKAWPPDRPEFIAARKAYADLLARKGDWDQFTRSDERLAHRYLSAMKANEVDIVAHAKSLGLLPTQETT